MLFHVMCKDDSAQVDSTLCTKYALLINHSNHLSRTTDVQQFDTYSSTLGVIITHAAPQSIESMQLENILLLF